MTTDFSRARLNMVNAQLATNGIHSENLIEAYKALPRESFVDDAQKPYVYMDEDIPAGANRWLIEPMVEAKMVQEAVRGAGANALFLGATNLPAAVMLSQFIKHVTIVEPDSKRTSTARTRLANAGINNVTVIENDYAEGFGRTAPYDVIFIPGATAALSPVLAEQLAVGGVMICVLRESDRAQGRIIVARKNQGNQLDTTIVADASTPYLAGFEPGLEFVF